ncbi:hypothetical protein PVNG_02479 [Plasmodium vivax North Korean]|uniref:Translation initiation factor IF-2 n=1 Tax=Plasmodium vivax North Korean TaxID=1035514 RepID=A0A0J9TMI3_PLAVI|nr:hypothetical protein PVNG_02479 [Plasmodium vivax North Korean]
MKVETPEGQIYRGDYTNFIRLSSVKIKGKNYHLKKSLNSPRELCSEFGIKFLEPKEKKIQRISGNILLPGEDLSTLTLVSKSPVVAVMGHVNHGKTTLLDQIRKTNIASKEYSSITQHISSYQVRTIGGIIADIIVLVVAVDDGVQSQTKEVIRYYREHNLKLIVFANKIDRGGESSLEILKKQLGDENIELEEYGGDTMLLKGSAKNGQGIKELLEAITVLSEVEGFYTTSSLPTVGVILESRIEKGLGPTAEIITTRGILSPGMYLSGEGMRCKVKTILNSNKKKLSSLAPSTPAIISGFDELPLPGSRFLSFNTQEEATKHYKQLNTKEREGYDYKDDSSQIKNSKTVHFSFIIKSKFLGSSEAIKSFILKFGYSVVYIGSGEITETDIKNAKLKNAIILNFEQPVPKKLDLNIESSKITI